MFVKKSTHDAVVAERDALRELLDNETSRLAQARTEKRQLEAAHDDLLRDLEIWRDRAAEAQAKVSNMTSGLKQNRSKIAA